MRLLRSYNRQEINLSSATTLGVGGEARIFEVAGSPGLAAKVYHRPTPERAAKLAAMLANPPENPTSGEGHVSIAWPLELLLDDCHSRTVAGFLMPLVKGMSPIIDFYHPRTRRHKHPLFNYRYLLRTARNLSACVGALHARGYVIGDLNESNILVGETALVTLVDTDSFQVPDRAEGKIHHCRVGKPEFTPPELQSVKFAWVDRKPEQDLFGLAIIIFQLLMEGTHPFAGRQVGRGEPLPLEERIGAGLFPYSLKGTCGTLPMPTAPSFEFLEPRVQQLFLRCFSEGHAQPSERPTAQVWQEALQQAEDGLATCAANPQHRFGKHLRSCPWCERQRLLGGLDPFPSVENVQRRIHLRPVLKRRSFAAQGRPVLQRRDFETAAEIARTAIVRQQMARSVLVALSVIVGLMLFLWAFGMVLAGFFR